MYNHLNYDQKYVESNIFNLINLISIFIKEFHDFHVDFLKNPFNQITLGPMITDRESVFAIISSEYKDMNQEFEASFEQCNDYRNTLKNDNEDNEQCLVFYQCFHEFHVKFPNNFKKAYELSVVKFKLKKLENEPSISNFKIFIDLFHNKSLL